jgi:hypothetical protein
MDDKKAKEEAKRARENEELIKRMHAGESLTRFDSSTSWFPPRPIIEKDKKALDFLHKSQTTAKKAEKKDKDKDVQNPQKSEKRSHLKII